jgi:hypothetical protein
MNADNGTQPTPEPQYLPLAAEPSPPGAPTVSHPHATGCDCMYCDYFAMLIEHNAGKARPVRDPEPQCLPLAAEPAPPGAPTVSHPHATGCDCMYCDYFAMLIEHNAGKARPGKLAAHTMPAADRQE